MPMRRGGVEPPRSIRTPGLQPGGPANAQPSQSKWKAEDSNPKPFGSTCFQDRGRPTGERHLPCCEYPVRVSIPVLRIESAPSHHSTNGAYQSGRRWARSTDAMRPSRLAIEAAANPLFTFHVRPGWESNPRRARLQRAAFAIQPPGQIESGQIATMWLAGIEPASPPWHSGILPLDDSHSKTRAASRKAQRETDQARAAGFEPTPNGFGIHRSAVELHARKQTKLHRLGSNQQPSP